MGVPDGANPGRHRATETGADDTGTDNTEQQDPGTPSDQVDGEIARAEISDWLKGLFGFGDPQPHEAGGGGTGGQFMFASIEELNGVIKQWEKERDGIVADSQAICDAYYMVKSPAADNMSQGQTTASKNSLATMWQHSEAMLKYANDYIAKLYASKVDMEMNEEGGRDTMRSVARSVEA